MGNKIYLVKNTLVNKYLKKDFIDFTDSLLDAGRFSEEEAQKLKQVPDTEIEDFFKTVDLRIYHLSNQIDGLKFELSELKCLSYNLAIEEK